MLLLPEKVTELAKDQTDSAREPSSVMGERVLKAEMELEVGGGKEETFTVVD